MHESPSLALARLAILQRRPRRDVGERERGDPVIVLVDHALAHGEGNGPLSLWDDETALLERLARRARGEEAVGEGAGDAPRSSYLALVCGWLCVFFFGGCLACD